MSKTTGDIAEFIAATMALGLPEGVYVQESGGVFERALHDVRHLLPEEIQDQLRFSVTGVGLRCLEWNDISAWMVIASLIEYDASSFTTFKITLGEQSARHVLFEQGYVSENCTELAAELREAIVNRTKELSDAL